MTHKLKKAVLYLRSSKDRNDVSPDAQRRELQALAEKRGVLIVGEYVDVVLSGQDDNRAGFQLLNQDLADGDREWTEILMLDTARLARNVYLSVMFEHEANKRGVRLVYAHLPEVDPILDVVLKNNVRAFDQVHSMQSKRKGLAGMAENVKQGWRAGGRAPFGYDLVHHPTGAIRDGLPVTKSKLHPNAHADKVAAYLNGRAAGRSGRSLVQELGLDISQSTLNGMEWNALTYAGATVWNVHNEFKVDGYTNGRKRRPRSEWLMNENTHPALITRETAEVILARLEKGRANYSTRSDYVLSGILTTPDGAPWRGNTHTGTHYYRAGKKSMKASHLEQVLLKRIAQDLASEKFSEGLVKRARAKMQPVSNVATIAAIDRELRAIDDKISRLMDLAAEAESPAPYTRKIDELEAKRGDLLQRKATEERTANTVRTLHQVSPADVHRLLKRLADDFERMDRQKLKEFLRQTVRAVLCPATFVCDLYYTLPTATGNLVASPRRSDEKAGENQHSQLKIPQLRRAA